MIRVVLLKRKVKQQKEFTAHSTYIKTYVPKLLRTSDTDTLVPSKSAHM